MEGLNNLVLKVETTDFAKLQKDWDKSVRDALYVATAAYLSDIYSHSLRSFSVNYLTTVTMMDLIEMFLERFIYEKPYSQICTYYHPKTVAKYCKKLAPYAEKIENIILSINLSDMLVTAEFVIKKEENEDNDSFEKYLP